MNNAIQAFVEVLEIMRTQSTMIVNKFSKLVLLSSIPAYIIPLGIGYSMRSMLRSKIHRATVTERRLDYEGSITIDIDLLERSGLWVGEKVLIADVNNGNRFETYTLPGERGSGIISLNGAAAHLCELGDKIIIMGFEITDEPVNAKVLLVDDNNKVKRELTY